MSTNKKAIRCKKLTFISVLALAVGNTVGSGIYLLPANLASICSISLYAWIFSTIGALSLAFIFSVFSKKIKNTGGPYIYVTRALGEFMGFQTAFSYSPYALLVKTV
jgi:amino acid transporter